MRYPAVKQLTPAKDYILTVTFDNGECGMLDMKPVLEFGIFQRLKDKDAFNRVRVSFDTIEWGCGVDLEPEHVYEKCVATDAAMNPCPTKQEAPTFAVSESGGKYET